MGFCDNCGEKLKEGAVFCSVCGSKVVNANNGTGHTNKHKDNLTNEILVDARDILAGVIESIKRIWDKLLNWYTTCFSDLKKGEYKNKRCIIWLASHIVVIAIVIIAIIPSKKDDLIDVRANGAEAVLPAGNYASEDDTNEIEESIEKAQSVLQDIKDNVDFGVKVLFSSLQGKWSDANGYFTLTINDDGTVQISDAKGLISADAFTYTEVDDDTVALKVKSDKLLAQLVSFNMDYHVEGEVLTISIPTMDISYDLQRVK